VRLSLLSIVFQSLDLPEAYPQARFVMWLQQKKLLDGVKAYVAKKGESFDEELRHMYVSPVIAGAMLAADSKLAASEAEARAILKTQYPHVEDISNVQMVDAIRDALNLRYGTFPGTLIVLDELQQYIGTNPDRTRRVQEVTEACSKGLGGKMLFVATGQSALTDTPELQKLKDRFRVLVELSDADVETVIRKVVLAKKPSKQKLIGDMLTKCSGEISRHLVGTKIGPRTEDKNWLEADYPLLPVRRRFWEKALRAVDRAGTAGQLRTQMRIVYEAVRATADKPLGSVVPADFLFDQTNTELLQTGILLREINELIAGLRKTGTPDGVMRSRLCALIFLINQLPRESGSDIGVRASAEVLADLLVEDLQAGSSQLRQQIPALLQDLVDGGQLMQVDNEYRIQTRESREWDQDYRARESKINGDAQRVASERADELRKASLETLKDVKLQHGKSKVSRRIESHFAADKPELLGHTVPVWIRDEWSVDLKTVQNDAHEAGTDSPVVFIFLPRRSADSLKKAIASQIAAIETLQVRGIPSTDDGKVAQQAMETRKSNATRAVASLINEVLRSARVFQGGGNEISGITLPEMVRDAAAASLARMYPRFDDGDDPRWADVVTRARKGAATALEALDYKGAPEKHAVTIEILKSMGAWLSGKELRRRFTGAPYGWQQDTVDGAILTLVVLGQLQAKHNEEPKQAKDLDQTRIGVAEFRTENIFLTAAQKLAVRKLFQAAGVNCKAGEESPATTLFLVAMYERAAKAGGDPPAPERPGTAHLKVVEGLTGNEQLANLHDTQTPLIDDAREWERRGKLIEKRMPRWRVLCSLLKYADGMPVATEVRPQADAIESARSLLSDPDQVPPLCDRLTQVLRKALSDAHSDCGTAYANLKTALESHELWQRLSTTQRSAIMAEQGLQSLPGIQVGTEVEVLASLENYSLSDWVMLRDAMPERFAKALKAAAKLLEPKAVHVKLPGGTLKTEADVEAWLEKAKKEILKAMKDGPVVV
jgi:hypothetical protein